MEEMDYGVCIRNRVFFCQIPAHPSTDGQELIRWRHTEIN